MKLQGRMKGKIWSARSSETASLKLIRTAIRKVRGFIRQGEVIPMGELEVVGQWEMLAGWGVGENRGAEG